jgi:hypothetical protein
MIRCTTAATQTGSSLYVSPQSFPVNTMSNGVPLYQFPNWVKERPCSFD